MGSSSGSSKGRKGNDRVEIKPISRSGSGSGSEGGSSTGGSTTCPVGFEMVLPEASKLPDGTRLTLRQKGDAWVISANGQEVAALRKDKAEMLTLCLDKGYRYGGVVRIKSKRRYAEFKRS